MIRQIARAKVNLTLHVGRAIEAPNLYQGYHPLDSLVAFADISDVLTARRAGKTNLTITGPFAGKISAGKDNLIVKAYQACLKFAKIPPLDITLEKNLPVAAGLGGGSANAAAVLRLLKVYADLSDERWHEIALSLGADVPVCQLSQTAHMHGIGEAVSPLPRLGSLPAILLNPNVAVPTGPVFKVFDLQTGTLAPCDNPHPQLASGDLLSRTLAGRNDLQLAAIKTQPVISHALRIMAAQEGCQIARMSGSGASCFAIFTRPALAESAARAISHMHPDWWVKACTLGEPL
jgi:4-diphosphocytidyl-2-C-methyl-D-erythritol kinase